MQTRTKIVAVLAMAFLAMRVLANILEIMYGSEPTLTLYLAIDIVPMLAWIALLLGVRLVWWPLTAYYLYLGIQCLLSTQYLRTNGLPDATSWVFVILLSLAQVIPLIALIFDPSWQWNEGKEGKSVEAGESASSR